MRFMNTWSRQKIFVIGFNKCGTTSLHRFFQRNGIRSAHFRADRGHIGPLFSLNHLKKRDMLSNLMKYAAFSDMCFHTEDAWIEANKYFPDFHAQYPRALFIFNDRPVENWIRSRVNKEGFLDLACRYFKTGPDEVRAIWRRQYDDHRERLLAYSPRMENFLHYDIERDSPEKVIAFVRRSFAIADGTYSFENRTATSE